MFPVVTLIRGKAPDLSSLREKEQLLMNLQGLDCLRLQTVHMLKRQVMGDLFYVCVCVCVCVYVCVRERERVYERR